MLASCRSLVLCAVLYGIAGCSGGLQEVRQPYFCQVSDGVFSLYVREDALGIEPPANCTARCVRLFAGNKSANYYRMLWTKRVPSGKYVFGTNINLVREEEDEFEATKGIYCMSRAEQGYCTEKYKPAIRRILEVLSEPDGHLVVLFWDCYGNRGRISVPDMPAGTASSGGASTRPASTTTRSSPGQHAPESRPTSRESASDAGKKPAYSFQGQVVGIVPLDKYEGKAIPTGPNDGYVVVIKEVVPAFGTVPDRQGNALAYAIHSPTKLFAAPTEQVLGKRFTFKVWTADGEGFSLVLEAKEIEPAPE